MYSGTMSIPTTAWPSSRSTEVTLPIWIPAMSTAWPWPGVTDQRQPGWQRRLLLGEDPQHHRDAGDRQDDDRHRVLAMAAGLA
jgi:hypothetical protein